jgi:hypothetical protein
MTSAHSALSLVLLAAMIILGAATNWSGAQECPPGWKPVVTSFLRHQAERDAVDAAVFVAPDERAAWTSWRTWDWDRLRQRLAEMPEAVQLRDREESARKLQQLEVSVLTCRALEVGNGNRYMAQVDPDGRSFQSIALRLEEGQWFVHTAAKLLDAEQRRVVTAYLKAIDEEKWDRAEAWVAKQALPRFSAYRSEVHAFLTGNAEFSEARNNRAAMRAEEWSAMKLWSRIEDDGVMVVSAQFPTAPELACELIQVDETWRILHR